MPGLELGDELVAHRLIREQIISLTREQSRHRYLIVLIRFDPQLSPMVAIRNERLVKLLHGEGEREILRVSMPDVADQAMKNSI